MKCQVHVYLLNEHFSTEHAEANYGGEESELNRKYEWQDELEVTSDITEIVEHKKGVYPIQGAMPDGEAFSHDVPAMRLFELKSEEGSTLIGCSESILDSCEVNSTGEAHIIKMFIKDYEPMANPISGIYIAAQEFPKALIL
ncbi:MAG: hypothetical protein QNK23_18355 [Crocinitomicaceae bacterium]|nr:hypothetical protein [Crocinitomicaceae bacterium]